MPSMFHKELLTFMETFHWKFLDGPFKNCSLESLFEEPILVILWSLSIMLKYQVWNNLLCKWLKNAKASLVSTSKAEGVLFSTHV